MIELTNIRKVFNQDKPNAFTAIHGVSFTIDSRKVTVFKGPSGSGKTTLLSMIGCMARPTSGRITLMDREITSLPERFLTEIRRKTFGFIFQQFNLLKGISVLENVMLPAYPTGESYASLKRRALSLLDLFEMEKKASSRVEWLSGGEAQRAAIARALINALAMAASVPSPRKADSTREDAFFSISKNPGGTRPSVSARHNSLHGVGARSITFSRKTKMPFRRLNC